AVGAPVEFRGIPIGEVLDIGVDYDPSAKQINVPVLVRLYPDRLVSRLRKSRRIPSPDQQKKEFEDMVNNGLRAQLRIASLLTGQLYVALDFLPNAGKVKLDWSKSPLEIPTAPGDLQELQTTITRIASKIDKIPFEQLADDLRTTMHSLDTTLRSTNALVQKLGDEVTPEIKQTLSAAQQTLDSANRVLSQDSPAQQDLRDALREVARAAESVRTLTEYLDKHPESLIRGKQSENKQ
ncbi:MAG TPA: MlaD family protein, partial [Rhodocyclaceae bacterium]|nr:MlaD family protein [Rhodocyclaceae bacterium]